MHVLAVISMLHEPASGHSAQRLFRGSPVLGWTADRLARSGRMAHRILFCWSDQATAARAAVTGQGIEVIDKGPRQEIASMAAVSAARRWADGWRGGLLGTSEYDAGFHGPWTLAAMEQAQASHVLLIDPASGLVDGQLVDRLIDHAEGYPEVELFFTQAPGGLCGLLIKRELVGRLAGPGGVHPGRLLHYMPQQPAPDPIGGNGCCRLAAEIERSLYRFKLDSDRQVQRLTSAMESLNGSLAATEAQELIGRMNAAERCRTIPPAKYCDERSENERTSGDQSSREKHDRAKNDREKTDLEQASRVNDADDTRVPQNLPREIVLELTTRRATRPIFSPATLGTIQRDDLPMEIAGSIFAEIGKVDDIRLTLAGVGDPLLHGQVIQIIELAQQAGVRAIHIETDLLDLSTATLDRLGISGVDAISVHMPGVSTGAYQAVMGVDGYMKVLENLQRVLTSRQTMGRQVPLIVPMFAKCRQNLAEMEAWYDQWLGALGSAGIFSPETFAGLMPESAVADMAPDRRVSCRRIQSRLMVLSDGTIVPCEMDVAGKMAMGKIGQVSLQQVWTQRMQPLRQAHEKLELTQYPVCGACRAWHRP